METMQSDTTHSFFRINPSLVSKRPFSLVTTLIPSGPFAGRHAFVIDPVSAPSRQSSFLQLVPEVRNNIYRFLLTSSRQDDVVNIMGGSLKTLRGLRGDQSTHPRHRNKRIHIAGILSCSKLVHQEAGSILYGCNFFPFHNMSTLTIFLRCIGHHNRQQLIHLRLRQIHPTRHEQAGTLLADAAGLRHLELGVGDWNSWRPIIEVERLIETFHATFENIDRNNRMRIKG